ncbi:MAG: hypothetical protein KAG84_05505 [Bacteroidales bacterium]|nr:hypothetical protein [Bacteroidales bacterium]
MKKLSLLLLVLLGSIIALSSCQSRGQKCPGMYTQNETIDIQKPITSDNLD